MNENNFDQPPKEIPQNEEEVTITDAIGFIEAIKQECSSMGANDSEIPDLEKLIEAVKNKVITPIKAKEQATQIKESKQDYH